MKLRTKLILSFFLLAVLPLTLITLYSYASSIRTFRKAVEAESGALADEMGSRMESLRRDLAFRVERMGRLPLRQLMTLRDADVAKVDPQSNPVMAGLLAEIGDAAPYLDSIEFSPSTPKRPPPPSPEPGSSAPARKPPLKPPPDLHRLVIHLAPPAPDTPAWDKPTPAGTGQEEVEMHLRPNLGVPLPPEVPRTTTDAERQRFADQIRDIQEFRVVLEQMHAGREAQKAAVKGPESANAAKKPAAQAPRTAGTDALSAGLSSVVQSDGNAVGTVRAHLSRSNIYSNILSRGRRRQGEIPFLVDADNQLHTINQGDQQKLESLKLSESLQKSGKTPAPPELEDWVVVTRTNEAAGVTFGIARPVSSSLREIRGLAVRNLGYGLGMVALALVGILPLSNRITRNLATLAQGAHDLAQGDLNVRVPVQSRDEIGKLAESFNRMAQDLQENQKHLVERERMRKELEMSRRIQEELLPKHPLRTGAVEIKGVSLPAREVGGDFFNYFLLADGEVAILVGDVSGKGVAAALLMANFQATLQARLPLAGDLSRLAVQLDRELAASTPQEVYLTLFMAILNPREKQLRYVNAGHNPQFALQQGGKIRRLESTGRPLGLLPGGDFAESRVGISAGDALFLYTDGLVEATDATGREFGQERLENLLVETVAGSPGDILSRVESEIRKYRGPVEAADDATMLVLKVGA